jgi:hypothetical protein
LGDGIQRIGVDDAWRRALGEEGANHFVALASESGADSDGIEFLVEDIAQVRHWADHDLWNHGAGEDGGNIRGHEKRNEAGSTLDGGG